MKTKFTKIVMTVLAIMLVAVMSVCLCACKEDNSKDLEYIKNKGTLVVGVTDYAPMDYQDEEGKWIGFDADAARLLGTELGVKVEFVEIDWEQKITELKTKKIDLIWNGMTMSDDLLSGMDFSYAYATNSQVAVIKKDKKDTYKTIESMKGAKVAVESGSAGEKEAKKYFDEKKIIGLQGQMKALQEVAMGTSDIAFVDYSLAASQCGNGTFADMIIVDGLRMGEEEFGVGVRKGSPLVAEVNKCLVKYYKNGELDKLRKQYGEDKIALKDLSDK